MDVDYHTAFHPLDHEKNTKVFQVCVEGFLFMIIGPLLVMVVVFLYPVVVRILLNFYSRSTTNMLSNWSIFF